MDSFQSVLGDAAGGALCNLLTAYGSSAPLLTAISLIEPTPIGEGLAVSAGLAGLAATVGCQWDMDKPGPDSGGGVEGCMEVSPGGSMNVFGDKGNGEKPIFYGKASKIIKTYIAPTENLPDLYWIEYVNEAGTSTGVFQGSRVADYPNWKWVTEVTVGTCISEPTPGPADPPPYIHNDPESGCEINVTFQSWALDQAGNVGGVWLMKPETQSIENSGGRIGACNFLPTIYYDGGGGGRGGGGGPIDFPAPDPIPDSPIPEWLGPLLRKAAQGLATAVVERIFAELFDTLYEGGSYSVEGVCEVDSNGDPMPVTYSSNFPPAKGIEAVVKRLDALGDLPNYSKQLRQPTCMGCVKKGEPVTINFESLAPSINGNAPLRKQFTYYDQTGSPLEVHASHWKDFTWESGPFVVTHQGANWGKLVVWGATAEEGKRVIRHAGEVAGINPDSSGYWHVQESSAPRYGRRGTMRVEIRPKRGNGNRYLMVTKRDSPNGLPLAIVLSASDI